MASYVVYSYQFSPKTDNQMKLFSEYGSQEEVWEHKQEIFGKLFNSDIVFTYRSHTHGHEILFNKSGLIITISQRYKTQEFWDIIDKAEKGVKMVRFSLQ